MITPDDIKAQLIAELPKYTDEFGDIVEGSAVVNSGVIKVTSTAHGLTTGGVIIVSDVKVTIPISSVTFDAITGKATLTAEFEHDRTSGTVDNGGFNKAVLQNFADDNYNGDDFTIETGTRTTMEISAESAPVGDLGEMVEPRSRLLGGKEVTVIDANTFTVSLEEENIPNDEEFDVFRYTTEQRILVAADEQRAIDSYKQRRNAQPTLFVIFGPEVASKDRHVTSDAVAAATAQNPLHITYIPEVSLLYMAITKKELLAETKQQLVYSEIRVALRKSMYGYIFDNLDTIVTFAAHEIGNTPVRYNSGYYIHRFEYNVPYRVSITQGNISRTSVSFRDLIVNSTMFNTEGALLSLELEPEI